MDPMTALHRYIDVMRSMSLTLGRRLSGRIEDTEAIDGWRQALKRLPEAPARADDSGELGRALELFGRVAAECRAVFTERDQGGRTDDELVSRIRELLDHNDDMNEAWSEVHQVFPEGLPLSPHLPDALTAPDRRLVDAATDALDAAGSKSAVIDVPASNIVVAVGRPEDLIGLLTSRKGR